MGHTCGPCLFIALPQIQNTLLTLLLFHVELFLFIPKNDLFGCNEGKHSFGITNFGVHKNGDAGKRKVLLNSKCYHCNEHFESQSYRESQL